MAILKVVGEEQLEACTKEGWKLEDTRETENVMNICGQEVVLVPSGNGYSTPQAVYVTGQRVVKGLRFILSKDEESVLAVQAEELVKLRAEMKVLGEEKAKWTVDAKSWEEREQKWTSCKERLEKDLKDCREDFIKVQCKVGEYELDMGKLRQEFGAVEMRRVTGR